MSYNFFSVTFYEKQRIFVLGPFPTDRQMILNTGWCTLVICTSFPGGLVAAQPLINELQFFFCYFLRKTADFCTWPFSYGPANDFEYGVVYPCHLYIVSRWSRCGTTLNKWATNFFLLIFKRNSGFLNLALSLRTGKWFWIRGGVPLSSVHRFQMVSLRHNS